MRCAPLLGSFQSVGCSIRSWEDRTQLTGPFVCVCACGMGRSGQPVVVVVVVVVDDDR